MKVTFHPNARAELLAATNWYEQEAGRDQAADFRLSAQRVLTLLTAHPEIGTPALHGTRSTPMHRYPYSVIYRVAGDTLRILAIAHQSRRPMFWGGRR